MNKIILQIIENTILINILKIEYWNNKISIYMIIY